MSRSKRRGHGPALEPVAGNGLINRRALLGQGIAVAGAVTAAYDFSGLKTIVDVGGATGHLLTPSCGSKRTSRSLSNPGAGKFQLQRTKHSERYPEQPALLHQPFRRAGHRPPAQARHPGMVRQPSNSRWVAVALRW